MSLNPNNMAFEVAADNAQLTALLDENFKQLVYGDFGLWPPTISTEPTSYLQTYSLNWEILGLNRIDQYTPEHIYYLGNSITDSKDIVTLLEASPINLHSMAALSIRLFADFGGENNGALPTEWKTSASSFWPLLFDDDFAEQIGIATLAGTGNASSKLASILAYSAIDEGERPFGDTGIRAFYDDANDLGAALQKLSETTVYATDISKVFVEFAGQLALKDIEKYDQIGTALAGATHGVLT